MLLATSVIGSYSVPEWLQRVKTDYHQRRISAQHLDEIHNVAIKAAIKDQERGGLDIVSDGELRRDNDIDYLLMRIPGVDIPRRAKTDYYDYYEAALGQPLPDADRGGPAWPPTTRSPGSRPTSRSRSRSPARSRCPGGSATPPTRTRPAWSGRWPGG